MKKILAGLLGLGFVMVAAPAVAGEWRVDHRICRDLVEDRYDARRNNGPRDRAEDRRDRRITVCPRRAFYYVPDRNERKRKHYRKAKRHHDGYVRSHKRSFPKMKYSKRYQMSYVWIHGQKIYVR